MNSKENKAQYLSKEKEALTNVLMQKESRTEILNQAYRSLYENLELLDDKDMEIDSVKTAIDTDLVEESIETIIYFESLSNSENDIDIESAYKNGLQYYKRKKQKFEKKKIYRAFMTKVASIFLALGICSGIVAQVMGFDVFGIIVDWGKEQFHISSLSKKSDRLIKYKDGYSGENISFDTIEEAENCTGIKIVLPKYIPSGYTLLTVEVAGGDLLGYYLCAFINSEIKTFTYTVTEYTEGVSPSMTIEKNDIEPELYNYNGHIHYLMSNMDKNEATWVIDNNLYNIFGSLSFDEIKEMINSTY